MGNIVKIMSEFIWLYMSPLEFAFYETSLVSLVEKDYTIISA